MVKLIKSETLGEKLGELTAKTFEKYGEFVGRNPGKILIITFIFVLITYPGIAFIRINLDLYKLFVPEGAPVRTEFETEQAYNKIPAGSLDVIPPPPPSLIDQTAANNLKEIPESESALDELQKLNITTTTKSTTLKRNYLIIFLFL